MQKPSTNPVGMTFQKAKGVKLVVVAPKTVNNFTATESNRDGGHHYYPNMRTRNFRQTTMEKSELIPAIFRAKSYHHERGYDVKIAAALMESQVKEKSKATTSIVDEIVPSQAKIIHSTQSMRPRSNYAAKKFSIRTDKKKNLLRPPTEAGSPLEKLPSYKFLKPVSDTKTAYGTFNNAVLASGGQAFTTPDTNLRHSFPVEEGNAPINLLVTMQQKDQQSAQSANYSFDQNDVSLLNEKEMYGVDGDSFQCNFEGANFAQTVTQHPHNALISRHLEPRTFEALYQPERSDPSSTIVRGPQSQRGYTQPRKSEVQVEEGSEKNTKLMTSGSPNRRYKVRPPTSPIQSAMQFNPSAALKQSGVMVAPNTGGKSSVTVNNIVVVSNEGYNDILNGKKKKSEQNVMGSPYKSKKDDRPLTEKEKIADIRQMILNTEQFNTLMIDKMQLGYVPDQSETCENSIVEDQLSQEQPEPDELGGFDEEEIDESCPTNRTLSKKMLLLRSVYAGRPSTIFFPYPSCCEHIRDVSRTFVAPFADEKGCDVKYKSLSILCVTRTFEAAGLKKTNGSAWSVLWSKPKYDRVKEMNKYQKTNHFPGCWEVGRKDGLWRNLSKMKRQFPNDYTFIPSTYLLATDYDRFQQVKDNAESKAIWIMKPCASACGRGIKLINKKTKLAKNKNFLVSEYISNPHLIDGLKYDLRVYVLVSSFDPLRIYLFHEGLVRFATEKYSTTKKDLKERFAHLTNWSVNKHSNNFVKNQDADHDGEGSKWSFTALRERFQQMGIDYDGIFEKIKDIIIKTMIGVEPLMLNSLNRTPEHRNNCFELYGFDVLLDANLKPWLMEVNVCPSLNSSTPLDRKIKTSLICDIMNLIGVQPHNKKRVDEEAKRRLLGQDNRKYVAKNCNDILDLDETNCIEKLAPDDWNVLLETDEEWYRKGNFERIFPLKDSVPTYGKYFEYPRYNNIMVSQWLRARTNFLEKITEKVASQAV